MNILFLDDSENRHIRVRRALPSVNACRNAADCVSLLQNHKFDLVSLDHDLGGETFVSSDRKDCGMEVVRWIVLHKPLIDYIVVHSANRPAAEEMKRKLKDAGYFVLMMPCAELGDFVTLLERSKGN